MAKESTGDYAGTTNGLTNYEGVLYNFSGAGSTEMTNYGQGTTNYREPDGVSDYDSVNYASQGITRNGLQGEYNAMIASVKQNGGFYVSRYEMGIDNGNVISKKGVTPTSEHDDATKMWYGLYKKAKTYTNTANSVTSSMIWGSQYDAMLNFALNNGNDSNKVNATGNANQNYSNPQLTGNETRDIINNIFDLEGNMDEWTLEANDTYYRFSQRGRLLRQLSSELP